MSVISKTGDVLFKKKNESIKNKLEYADIKINSSYFSGLNFWIVLILSFLIGYIIYTSFNFIYSLLAVGLFVLLYYIFLTSIISLMSDKRAKFVENILPDVLRLISSNLKSGISIDEAIVLSARPEFGFFSEKIKEVGKLLATGKEIEDSIKHLSKGINSNVLDKTIQIIVEGLKSGGELSILLESIANNVEETEVLKKEVNSSIFIYALFIFIAGCLIAPILYAVSIQLAGVLSRLSESIAVQFIAEETTTPVTISPVQISESFLMNFAYINLIITTAFASLIIALINKGNEKYGIKYIPFLIGLSITLFYLASILLNYFFGGIKII